MFARPICSHCKMTMIVAAGFDRDPEHQTHECLRCGFIETAIKPAPESRRTVERNQSALMR